MAVNKVYKIPRDVLAKMTDNNPQAIAALENIEITTGRTPQQIEELLISIVSLGEKAEQAAIIATQSTAIAQQLLSDLVPQLNAVSVPQAQTDVLNAVNVSIEQDNLLQPVGSYQDCPIQLMPI